MVKVLLRRDLKLCQESIGTSEEQVKTAFGNSDCMSLNFPLFQCPANISGLSSNFRLVRCLNSFRIRASAANLALFTCPCGTWDTRHTQPWTLSTLVSLHFSGNTYTHLPPGDPQDSEQYTVCKKKSIKIKNNSKENEKCFSEKFHIIDIHFGHLLSSLICFWKIYVPKWLKRANMSIIFVTGAAKLGTPGIT